jgi:sterol desaturase/sphingolipid hydroxylase (fatty acid hydroxylase superfamily)
MSQMLSVGIFFGMGVLIHFAEKRWSLRTYEKPKAWMIDTFGFLSSSLATYAFRLASPHTFQRLPKVPGFEWISTASRFVEANVPWPVALLLSVVILDFLLYVGHRLLHTSYLWHTHAVHHSVEHLYWFGGNRASPFHVMFQLVWGALLGLVWPVNGGTIGLLAILILYTWIQHFNHANLRWRLGPLEWLFVVPRYHFVHHGAAAKLNDSNFGFLLTVWDRMFGTYTNPDNVRENFPLGLDYEVGMVKLFVGLPPKSPARTVNSDTDGAADVGLIR